MGQNRPSCLQFFFGNGCRVSENGKAKLYLGRIMHMRLRPVRHQFRYRVFSLLLDVDSIDETVSRLRFMRRNGFNLFSFYDRDHGARDGTSIRPWLENLLADEGIEAPDRISLVSFPRVLGFTFNPISIFFCFNKAEELTTVIYEVKNTFGDQVPYVIPFQSTNNVSRQQHRKQMYVSPFIEMDQTYRFTLSAPGNALSLRIKQSGKEGETLIATHNADAVELTDAALCKVLLTHPLMTLKVVAGIHFEAFRLFIKGVKFNRYSQSQIFLKKEDSL